jgi:small subunit ribosomal protein S8
MSNNLVLNLCNTINTNKQNKSSIVKIKYSRKCIAILGVLLEEGYIRGFFIESENNVKIICILLKYVNEYNLFNFKTTSSVKTKTYTSNKSLRKQVAGFNFGVISTQKGIMSSSKAISLGIGGFSLIEMY